MWGCLADSEGLSQGSTFSHYFPQLWEKFRRGNGNIKNENTLVWLLTAPCLLVSLFCFLICFYLLFLSVPKSFLNSAMAWVEMHEAGRFPILFFYTSTAITWLVTRVPATRCLYLTSLKNNQNPLEGTNPIEKRKEMLAFIFNPSQPEVLEKV